MNYWLHRCAYEGGLDILDREHRLTIGFSDCAAHPSMVAAIQTSDGNAFDACYREVYSGNIWRSRWSLWYFCCEMCEGDVVVVPRPGGFSICRLKGALMTADRREGRDLGFEREVEMLADACSPREAYASTALLSRMKCRQTTIRIDDLADDVETALRRVRDDSPFSLPAELARHCHSVLSSFGSPDHFEQLVRDYFVRLGAKAEILPKHYADKVGDCDVSAVFPALRLTVSCQVKKHWGKTDDWAVRQIVDFAKDQDVEDPNWIYANWVVSFAEEFSDEAKSLAKANGVVLLTGADFCGMLIANGLGVP